MNKIDAGIIVAVFLCFILRLFVQETAVCCDNFHLPRQLLSSIPYNREEVAALLCVDRSALSTELSKMQAAGLIRFHKNEFELL